MGSASRMIIIISSSWSDCWVSVTGQTAWRGNKEFPVVTAQTAGRDPAKLWGPPCLLCNGCQGPHHCLGSLFFGVKAAKDAKPVILLHLVQRMSAAFPSSSSIFMSQCLICQSHWPHGPRRWSAAARLLRLRVRIPPGTWMFVFCECCVLSDRGLCDELITRPEESYWLWCVVVCDILVETSWMKRSWVTGGCKVMGKKIC